VFAVCGKYITHAAGKTTIARQCLPEDARVIYFLDADLIARGLSPLKPDHVGGVRHFEPLASVIGESARMYVDIREPIPSVNSMTWMISASGLKIRVSVAQFHPWPPFENQRLVTPRPEAVLPSIAPGA
jgi:hypothetical protein